MKESKKIIINNENIEPQKIDDNGNNVKDNNTVTKKYKNIYQKFWKILKKNIIVLPIIIIKNGNF